MSTAFSSGAPGPVIVKRKIFGIPRSLAGSMAQPAASRSAAQNSADLTIHRITRTHHGRTLLLLGHAAEHLANAGRFATQGQEDSADTEAIHILMSLSRSVFEEFAESNSRLRRMEAWFIEGAAKVLEDIGRKKSNIISDNERLRETCITC